jgi:hypothetical protein
MLTPLMYLMSPFKKFVHDGLKWVYRKKHEAKLRVRMIWSAR